MPGFGSVFDAAGEAIQKALPEALNAVKEPAVPEAAARGTAAAPTVLQTAQAAPPRITQRAPAVPFAGEPALQAATRATTDHTTTLAEHIQNFKTLAGGMLHRDPNLPKDVQANFQRARAMAGAANQTADLDVSNWLSPLHNHADPPTAMTQLSDYAITADEVAQALRAGKDRIRTRMADGSYQDQPLELWQSQLQKLQNVVDASPEITQSLQNIRDGLDAQFMDSVQRGWQMPEHYLEDYTPIRRINTMVEGLATMKGLEPGEFQSSLLSELQHRAQGMAAGTRETNLIDLLRTQRAAYLRHAAEHEAYMDILGDPTLTLTDKFQVGDELPRGLSVWNPGRGMIGYSPRTPDEAMHADAMAAITGGSDRTFVGGQVHPTPLVKALKEYHADRVGETSKSLNSVFGQLARQLVVTPMNTNLNRFSDLPFALLGTENEPGHALGVLRWLGTAHKVAYKGAFTGEGTIVNVNGQPIDAWDLYTRSGAAATTLAHNVGAEPVLPAGLRELSPEAQQNHMNWLQQTSQWLKSDRVAMEAVPRIAAGLEAVQRTGDVKNFGPRAREAYLPYGFGAPKITQLPVVRAISPFLQFFGLATQRVLGNLKAENMATRGKMIAALALPPTVALMWNTQNSNYQQIEDALPDDYKTQMHIIIPDPNDPAKVRRDINGKPVVWTFRYDIPEEVMKMVGLGNMPSRLQRVARGRDKVSQFAGDIANTSALNPGSKAFSDLLTIPNVIKEVAEGKSETGRELTPTERALRVVPGFKPISEGVTAAKDYGPAEGARRAAEQFLGLSFAPVKTKGTAVMDAQLQAARQDVAQKKALYRWAVTTGAPDKLDKAKKDLDDSIAEMQRVAGVYKAEKTQQEATGTLPAKPGPEVGAERRAAIEAALRRYKGAANGNK